jgi:hypothetical protein
MYVGDAQGVVVEGQTLILRDGKISISSSFVYSHD